MNISHILREQDTLQSKVNNLSCISQNCQLVEESSHLPTESIKIKQEST